MQNYLFKSLAMAKVMTNGAGFFDQLFGFTWYGGTLRAWVDGLKIEPNSKVLELGCGPGNLSHVLAGAGHTVLGVDKSSKMLKRARKGKSSAEFQEADALALPFSDNSFDVVIMASLYNIVPDSAALLAEAKRVVRSGGLISVLFPTPDFTVARADALAARQKAKGFSAAAMLLWASVGRKLERKVVQASFVEGGLARVESRRYLEGCVASVSGQMGASL
jgi:ubiquinone/menaquinone biosynthesis C-methylase UbiE